MNGLEVEVGFDVDESIALLQEAATEIERLRMELEFQTRRADKAGASADDDAAHWRGKYEELEALCEACPEEVVRAIRESKLRDVWNRLDRYDQLQIEWTASDALRLL